MRNTLFSIILVSFALSSANSQSISNSSSTSASQPANNQTGVPTSQNSSNSTVATPPKNSSNATHPAPVFANVSSWNWTLLEPINVTSNQRIMDMFNNGSIDVIEKALIDQNITNWEFEADLYKVERFNLSRRAAFFRFTAHLQNSEDVTIDTKFIMRLNRSDGIGALFAYENIVDVPEANFVKTTLLDNNPNTTYVGHPWNQGNVEVDIDIEGERGETEWDSFEFDWEMNQVNFDVQVVNGYDTWSMQFEGKERIA